MTIYVCDELRQRRKRECLLFDDTLSHDVGSGLLYEKHMSNLVKALTVVFFPLLRVDELILVESSFKLSYSYLIHLDSYCGNKVIVICQKAVRQPPFRTA